MNPTGEVSLRHLLKACVPSGLRAIWRRRALQGRHGLAAVAAEHEGVMVDTEFGERCRLGDRVVLRHARIGHYSYIESGSVVDRATVGNFCSIGRGVIIGPSEHPSRDFVSTHPYFYSPRAAMGYPPDRYYFQGRSETVVGNDVWIGAHALVRGGVTVGHGAIVGAGAVVVADVAPYAVVGGVPARHIRDRFDRDTVEFLLRFRWWDRDLEWLAANWSHFHCVERFREAFESREAAEDEP